MRFRKFRDDQTGMVQTRAFRAAQTSALITRGLRKGQIGVVMTLVIATLLGVMALGSDVAVMYYNWMQLQKAADASALAGATYFLTQNATQTLPSPTINPGCTYATQQQNVACSYALNNYAQAADPSQGGIYVPAETVPASAPGAPRPSRSPSRAPLSRCFSCACSVARPPTARSRPRLRSRRLQSPRFITGSSRPGCRRIRFWVVQRTPPADA